MTALELYSGLGRAEHSTSRELRAGVGELGEYREFRCARDVTRISRQAAPHRSFEAYASPRSGSPRWH